jgi:anti-sigma-K factor RskA
MERRRLTHETVSEELPAYALQALDPEETVALAEHVAGCPRCQEDLRRFDEVLGLLGAAVPQEAPPSELRARVLDRATAESVASQLPGRSVEGRVPGWVRVALAAAAVLVLALTATMAVVLDDVRQLRRELDALRAEQREIANILARATWWAPVTGETSQARPEVGRLYLHEGETGLLIIDGLPPLAPGEVYQVWLIRADETRVSAGVFTVDTAQRATLLLEAPGTWTAYRGMGITIEPGPAGSPGPTGPRVAGCSLADWQSDGL